MQLRRLVTMLLGGCVFLFAGLVAAGASDAPLPIEANGDLRVDFVTAAGPVVAPYFDVSGAYPGMEPERATVTVANRGTLDATVDLSAIVTPNDSGVSLADVLRVTVVRKSDGRRLYRGPLSGLSDLSVDGAKVLHAGASTALLMAIDWPDGGARDNAFQGQTLQFALQARASQAL